MSDFDPFDTFDTDINENGKQLILDYQSRLHKLFSQDEDGKKLLSEWFDYYLMNPIIVPGDSPEENGIREGKAQIVRHIFKVIALIDRNYDQPTQETENSDA